MAKETKICQVCGQEKPLARFARQWYKRNQKHYWRNTCKDCFNKRQKKHLENNPQSRETKRSCHLHWRFGITQENYDEMFSRQNGCCAICGQPEIVMRQGTLIRLAVDHDHKTGKVRELLCGKCNKALGFLDEDENRCRLMATYIKKHKKELNNGKR